MCCFQVTLDEGKEENFLEQLSNLNQSRQVLTQVMQHELDKIDMDLDKVMYWVSYLLGMC